MTNARRALVLGAMLLLLRGPSGSLPAGPRRSWPVPGRTLPTAGGADRSLCCSPRCSIATGPTSRPCGRRRSGARPPGRVGRTDRGRRHVRQRRRALRPLVHRGDVPHTARLLELVEDDVRGVVGRAKVTFNRPGRPWFDPHIAPCVHLPSGGSYPSGHASAIYARAEVLSEVFPTSGRRCSRGPTGRRGVASSAACTSPPTSSRAASSPEPSSTR